MRGIRRSAAGRRAYASAENQVPVTRILGVGRSGVRRERNTSTVNATCVAFENPPTIASGMTCGGRGRDPQDEGYAVSMERGPRKRRRQTTCTGDGDQSRVCMGSISQGRARARDDTGEVARDLKQIADTVVHLQKRTVAGPAFIGLIAEAQVSPETRTAFLAEFADRRREITRTVLRRAIERRQLRPDTDIDLVIDVIGGATMFRLLHARPLSKSSRRLFDLVLTLPNEEHANDPALTAADIRLDGIKGRREYRA